MNSKPPSMDELLAHLPTEVTPRDLWPSIASRIAPRANRSRHLVLAASVAGAALLASLLTVLMLEARRPPAPATTVAGAPVVASRPVDFGEPWDPAYVEARSAMERTFRARLSGLDPVTRAKIEASLATIRQAREEIREALAAAPSDPVLGGLLQSTLSDEFDLYDHVVRSTEPGQTRT